MYKTLRIICCVICALILAGCIFVFIYLGMLWGFVTLAVAAAFFGLMLLFKRLQEKEDDAKNPPAPKGDFITGAVIPQEENQNKKD